MSLPDPSDEHNNDPPSNDDFSYIYPKNESYTKGKSFTVRCHEPPPPPGHPGSGPAQKWHGHELDHLTQLEFCLLHPPEPGRTLDQTFTFTIAEEIAVGVRRGAQVVAISKTQVAKIYDSMFYPVVEPDGSRVDPALRADRDYSREAAAYEVMPAHLQGSVVPKYHGSYTYDMPFGITGSALTARADDCFK